jgi:hypothetical protein
MEHYCAKPFFKARGELTNMTSYLLSPQKIEKMQACSWMNAE